MDISPEILSNDAIRNTLVDGVCPYVLTGRFRAEREASEKTWGNAYGTGKSERWG